MQLSPQAADMIDLLLKHYPLAEQKEHAQHHSHTSPSPQQHMHDYRKERQIYEKPTQEKLQNMQFFKEEGNNHYKNQRYSEALYFYQKAIIYADYTFPENAAETEKMEALLQQANCNMALSLIKLDRCEEAKTNLTEALKGKSTAIASKGYYWLAKLHLRKGQLSLAKERISSLQSLGQQCEKQVEELTSELQSLEQKQLTMSKEAFKNMFKI